MALGFGYVYKLARDAGFSPGQAMMMTALAGAESGFDPNPPPHPTGDGYVARGILQISTVWNPQGGTDAVALDPASAFKFAHDVIFPRQGFSAWQQSIDNGHYKNFLNGNPDPWPTLQKDSTGTGYNAGIDPNTALNWSQNPTIGGGQLGQTLNAVGALKDTVINTLGYLKDHPMELVIGLVALFVMIGAAVHLSGAEELSPVRH